MDKTIFIIQRHQIGESRRVHWDLRIQKPHGKDLWSWAIPKSRMPDSGEKILAVRQPDHPPSFLDFEGKMKIKTGRVDNVEIVDRGKVDILTQKKDRLYLEFYGEKIQGRYMLINIQAKTDHDSWLLIAKK